MLGVFVHHYMGLFPMLGGSVSNPSWIGKTAYWGWTGVDLFFVLSGFLITGILYDSLDSTRYFSTFYRRRALRIFPLYYLIWAALLSLVLAGHVDFYPWLLLWPLYLGNYLGFCKNLHPQQWAAVYVHFNGLGYYALAIGHFWSLCVEEQFYLVWPAVVGAVRNRNALAWITAILVVPVMLVRIFLYVHLPPAIRGNAPIYYGTFTHPDSILAGCCLSLWMRGSTRPLTEYRWLSRGMIVIASAALIGGYFTPLGQDGHLLASGVITTYGLTAVALIACGFVMMALDPASWFYTAMRNPFLQSLGKVSYGFYLVHMLPLNELGRWGANSATWERVSWVLIIFVASYAVAQISFRFFETPILKLKGRWRTENRSVRSVA